MQIHCDSHLLIEGAPPDLVRQLHKQFRIRNPTFINIAKYSKYGTRRTKCPEFLYGGEILADDCIRLPRCVVVDYDQLDRAYGKLLDSVDIRDARVSVPIKFPPLKVQLNEMQEGLATAFKAACEKEVPLGYLLVTGTSAGKTIALANLARLSKQKTLILVHRNLIKDTAWQEDLKKMFDGAADVGIVQGSNRRIGKHFTVAMLQTVHKFPPDRLQEFMANFGTVISDECHTMSAETFRGVVGSCPALYRLAGTATPKKKYDLHKFMEWTFGAVAHKYLPQSSPNQMELAGANLRYTKFEFKTKDDDLDVCALMRAMSEDRDRNALIYKHVMDDYDAGHSVLVTTSLVEHAVTLCSMFRKRHPQTALMEGSRSEGAKTFDEHIENILSRKCRIVVATHQLISEGVSLAPLSRLHITSPIADSQRVIQLCGRVRRTHPSKKDCRVTVYFDTRVPVLRRRISNGFMQAMRELRVPGMAGTYIA